MASQDQSHDRQSPGHAFDRELDTVLAKYTAVEPRAGLEERVLANLSADRGRVPAISRWRWSVVSAVALTAVITVVVALTWKSGTRPAPVLANHPSTIAPSGQQPARQVATNGMVNDSHSQMFRRAAKRVLRRTQHAVIVQADPKLDQFPSPQPLSEQEKILTIYVERYPEQAALLARARADALRRDQQEEMQAFPSSSWAADSDERNNDRTNR